MCSSHQPLNGADSVTENLLQAGLAVRCDYCGAEPNEPCNPDCLSEFAGLHAVGDEKENT